MHIVIAANEAFFRGLACTVLSISVGANGSLGITFHILDGGISPASWSLLENDLALLGKEVHLKKYELGFTEITGMPKGIGTMAYARLLMPSLIHEDEVIYVDSDILAFCDMRLLWDEPMSNYLAFVCQDSNLLTLSDDPLLPLTKEEANSQYFNSGIMKVNLKLWRAEDIKGKTLKLLRDYGDKCVWHDQTALNYSLKGRVKFLDGRWNSQYLDEDGFSVSDFSEQKILIHYVTKRKPWTNYNSRYISSVLWWLFFFKHGKNSLKPSHGIERLKQNFYQFSISGLDFFGSQIIAIMTLACRCLGLSSRDGDVSKFYSWLLRLQTKLQILRWFKTEYR